ncbi:MAG: radical SAM family heme chaperone HemW [Chloroflexota bacterium]|nr:radical SAM family heme chaperone HemW [Chloroflexota bacterium]MDE2940906.1 radical SAM family heme chaperone HemW [Chloroflexota bacterium]MDE3268393.1 radical SAM family heme chaperone HemW [Chloroflexota bacterium]
MNTLPATATTSLPHSLSLYVHIPFCETKCPYCDFNTYAGIEQMMPAYVEALVSEIERWGAALSRPAVTTIFMGGGTPSYLPAHDLEAVLAAVRRAFGVMPDAEATMEANPGDLLRDRPASLSRLGFNRLSIGVQSLDDGLLRLLGRRHTAQEAADAYRAVRRAGFENVNLDLMYGLPHQSMAQWRDTLDGALALGPEHLSLYCLTLEEGTPMEQQVRLGALPEPDGDLAADMYLHAEETLAREGYRHYEISNWARPGLESRHNLTYWRNGPFLGVGPGAHSYLGRWRFHNLASPREYVRSMAAAELAGAAPATLSEETLASFPVMGGVEFLDVSLEMAETMMMGLRLDEGVSLASFESRFGRRMDAVFGEQLAELTGLGLLERDDSVVRLTARGRLLGNEVFLRFFG